MMILEPIVDKTEDITVAKCSSATASISLNLEKEGTEENEKSTIADAD